VRALDLARTAALSLALLGVSGSLGAPEARADTPPSAASSSPGAPPAGAVVLPRLLADPGVTYPASALSEGLREEVTVVLTLEIDATGAVRKATVDAPHGHGFDEAAVAAAEKATFAPATRGGVPFAARIKFQTVFRPPSVPVAPAKPAPDKPVDKAPPGAPDKPVDKAPPGTPDKPPGQAASPPGTAGAGAAQAVVDVDVRGERQPREVTRRTLTKQEIAFLPGTNGDALRSLQSLPGVARPPPFGAGLVVRGSAPRDTTYFVDGTPVPLVYHFGGLSSVLPTEVLDKIDFSPGNYSAAFGRGMGGLVDVGIRDPKSDGLHAMAQLDLIDARLLAEGPILDTGWKFLIAGRRSWFDAWLGPVLQATNAPVTASARYYDYQVMLEKDPTPTSSLRLLFFGTDDAIDVLGSNPNAVRSPTGPGLDLHTAFWRLQARYENRLREGTQLRAVLAGGQDTNDISTGNTFFSVAEAPITGRVELSQKVRRGIVANVGVDVLFSPYDVHIRRPAPSIPGAPSGGPLEPPLETSQSGTRYLTGLYTEWEIQPWRGLRVVPGLRLDYSSATKSWDLSPRINLRQDLSRGFPRTTLKAGMGLFYQPPQSLETDPVFGQPNLRSNRSLHTDVGLEQQISRQINLSVDVFAKRLDQLVTPADGNTGEGVAFGTEWLLRYEPDDRFFGWIAYTLSRSDRVAQSTATPALINYDQTHVLTVLGSYDFGHGIRAGLRFRLVSGNPYTPVTQGAYDATTGNYQPVLASPPNGSRLPLFHQLDLRFDKTWTFKSWRLSTYLDVQNVYNQENVEAITYNYDYSKSAPVAGLPFLPSLGLRGEL